LIGVYIINIDVAIILFSITTIIFIYVSYKQYKELYLEKKYKKIMLHICNEAKNKLKFFNSKSSNNTAYAVVTTSIHIYYLFLMYNCVNKKIHVTYNDDDVLIIKDTYYKIDYYNTESEQIITNIDEII
jgi:uncharacterized membrane protein